MKLGELINRCKLVACRGDREVAITSITSDSRTVMAGSLFIAVEGICTDGHAYIGKAIEQGAVAVVYDKPMIEEYFSRVTYVEVEDSTSALAQIASEWYGNPSQELKLVGVTGTNGKTTIATLLYRLFLQSGYRAGLLSTVANYVNEEKFATTHTTLDPISLNALLHKMVEAGCEYAFMEVSSHAIHQKRTHALYFRGGGCRNLPKHHSDNDRINVANPDWTKLFFLHCPWEASG